MTILITGANRCIGRALHDHYADAGNKVIGTYRTKAPQDGTWLKLDVTDQNAPADLATELKDTPLDMLVCNAGVYLDKHEDLHSGYRAQMWAETFAVNVAGVFQTIQALLPNLMKAGNPKIAIISSTMASQTQAPGSSYIYRASKAAVLNVGRNLATDLKPMGITVGIYHPGWVITDMGGAQASITLDEAKTGLAVRFAELDMTTTGCFKNWDGRDHAF